MAGYLGSRPVVVQVDGYQREESESRYVNVSGDDFSGHLDFVDDAKARFGSSDELHIYTESSGSGHSYIQGDNIVIRSAAGTARLTVTSNDVDVSSGALKVGGTTVIDSSRAITATGLTVDGVATLNRTNPILVFNETDTTDLNAGLNLNGSSFEVAKYADAGNKVNDILSIDISTGDISFYDSLGSSQSFFWDASAESLGIGTSSPDKLLTLSASNPQIRMYDTDGTNQLLDIVQDGNASLFTSRNNTSHGQFVFRTYNGTSVEERMRITSAGNVGIGVSDPDQKLEVNGVIKTSLGSGGLSLSGYSSPDLGYFAYNYFNNNGTETVGQAGRSSHRMRMGNGATNAITFDYRAPNAAAGTWSESMRLDASGNLLVGKTETAIGTVGFRVDGANGFATITRDGYESLILNRKTSNGDIAKFQKDGSTVGSIGAQTRTSNTELGIGTGDTGLNFFNQGDAICPVNMDNGFDRNGAIDLGRDGVAFKDLYLTGGIQFDSRSNKLDDYEEGTWTPTLNFGGNSTGMAFTTQSGSYVKIGTVVTAQFRIQLSSKGSSTGAAGFGGLPFNATSVGTLYPAFYGLHHDVNSGSGNTTTNVLPIGQIARTTNTWNYYQADSVTAVTDAYFNNNTVINGTLTFRVN